MHYVEILRARRVLSWFTGVLLASVALSAVSFINAHVQVHVGPGHIELTSLLVGSTMIAFVVATCMAPGLSAEGATIAIIWTRPTRRETIAWRYVAVDVAAILIAYLVSVVVAVAFIAAIGLFDRIVADSQWVVSLALGVGATLMWYALVVLASARFPGRGALIAGLSWAVFLVVAGLWSAPLPPLMHLLLNTLNYVNPMAYISGTIDSASGHVQISHAVALGDTGRAILAWCIAAVATTVAIRLWATREA